MGESVLKEKTSKGLFWGGMSGLLTQVLNAAFGIYLARTLSPTDYGLVGMLAIFTLLATIMQESGFPTALINRKEIRHEDYNSVFWFSLTVSVACYAVLFFSAPLIARYFHHPELVLLSRVCFLNFIVSGLGVSHRTYLSKNLMVREIAIVNIVAVVVSGSVGILLASQGYAYWTLVVQSLVLNFFLTSGYWLFSKWRPRISFDIRPIKEMFSYSVRILVTSILSVLNANLITVILGRYYSAERVGYYTQANKWSQMGVSVLVSMVTSVAQPVFAGVVDEQERQLRIFRRMMRFAAFISFPSMLGLAFIAPEFIPVVITDKWNDSILLLQILCAGGAFTPLVYVCSHLILSRGKASKYMWSQISLFAAILALVYLLYPKGITAMVIGISTVNAIWILVWTFMVKEELGYKFSHLFSDLVPFLLITCVSIAAAYFITRGIANAKLLLVSKILVTAAVYMILMRLSDSVTFKESVNFVLRRNK